jgi:hypothetical protein
VYDRITFAFIRYVIGYRRSMRPRVAALLAEHGGHARRLRFTSRRQANRFLRQLDAGSTAAPMAAGPAAAGRSLAE